MNISKKLAMLASTAILALSFFGCSSDKEDEGSGVDFNSYPRSIRVENKTGTNLVAFKSSLKSENLISGVPAFASDHGLKKEGVFTQTGDFVLIFISEEEYVKNKDNIASAAVFTEVYAFYNNEGENNNVFAISDKIGGPARLVLSNPTSWNIELRRDGPTGEVMGYVAGGMTNTALRLEYDDYNLYPVFKRYNPREKEMYEMVPKYPEGIAAGLPYSQTFTLTDKQPTQEWNSLELSKLITFNMSSGSFYLRVCNNIAGTAIRLVRGTEPQNTSIGVTGITSGTCNTYPIAVGRNPDGSYPASTTLGSFVIGTQQIPGINVPSNSYKVDYVYTIYVKGANASMMELDAQAAQDQVSNSCKQETDAQGQPVNDAETGEPVMACDAITSSNFIVESAKPLDIEAMFREN